MHEAIIPRELWERVQEKRGSVRHYTRGNGERSLFSGMLVCAGCGCNLHFHFSQKTPSARISFAPTTRAIAALVPAHITYAWTSSNRSSWRDTPPNEVCEQYETQFAKLMMGFTQQAMAAERKQVQLELSKAKARDRELDTLFEKLYEDNVAGKIKHAI